GKICHLLGGNQARPKLVILRDAIVFVVTSKLVADHVCAKDDRGVHEGVQKGRCPCDASPEKRRVEPPRKPFMLVDDPAVAAQEHDVGLGGGELVLYRKPQGMRQIV